MFKENKYKKWYFHLMESRKSLVRGGYLEVHHILPKSLGGSDDKSNLVALTAREHFIAHLMIIRMLNHPHKRKMQFALKFLMGKGRGKGRQLYIPNSKVFEIYRKECAASSQGKTWSKDQRKNFEKTILDKKIARYEQHCPSCKICSVAISFEDFCKGKFDFCGSKSCRSTITSRAGIGTKHPPRSEQWQQLQRESHLGLKDPNNPNRVAAHTGAKNPRAKTWKLEREDGSTFEVVALKTWCREQGLKFDHITRTTKTRKFVSGLRIA